MEDLHVVGERPLGGVELLHMELHPTVLHEIAAGIKARERLGRAHTDSDNQPVGMGSIEIPVNLKETLLDHIRTQLRALLREAARVGGSKEGRAHVPLHPQSVRRLPIRRRLVVHIM